MTDGKCKLPVHLWSIACSQGCRLASPLTVWRVTYKAVTPDSVQSKNCLGSILKFLIKIIRQIAGIVMCEII